MGWKGESHWTSAVDVAHDILDGLAKNGYRVVGSHFVCAWGPHYELWIVDEKKGARSLIVYLIENRDGWVYKDIDVCAHPCAYECPDELIELVGEKAIESQMGGAAWLVVRKKYWASGKKIALKGRL